MSRILNYSEFNNWEVITSNPKKMVNGKRLIDIVKNAYKNTNLGSFVRTMRDVLKSMWQVIDIKNDGDIDACIFYRKPRENEKWKGFKIQGIGHDGESVSRKASIARLVSLLEEDGYWIEASGKLESILILKGSNRIKDIKILKKLYPNSGIYLRKDGSYMRTLNDGKKVIESTFGNPIFK